MKLSKDILDNILTKAFDLNNLLYSQNSIKGQGTDSYQGIISASICNSKSGEFQKIMEQKYKVRQVTDLLDNPTDFIEIILADSQDQVNENDNLMRMIEASFSDQSVDAENTNAQSSFFHFCVFHYLFRKAIDSRKMTHEMNSQMKHCIESLSNNQIVLHYFKQLINIIEKIISAIEKNSNSAYEDISHIQNSITKFSNVFFKSKIFIERLEFTEPSIKAQLLYLLYREFSKFVLLMKHDENKFENTIEFESIEKETDAYISLAFSNLLYYMKDYTHCLEYAQNAIIIKNADFRQDAFLNIGNCALEANHKLQLAYDTYYSWINMDSVGEFQALVGETKETLWHDSYASENEWRQTDEGKRATAVMHNNFAYVCGCIADTYTFSSERGRLFIDEAVVHVMAAIEEDNNEKDYQTTNGTLCYDLFRRKFSLSSISKKNKKISDIDTKDLKKSAEIYYSILLQKGLLMEKSNGRNPADLDILRMYVDTLLELLVFETAKKAKTSTGFDIVRIVLDNCDNKKDELRKVGLWDEVELHRQLTELIIDNQVRNNGSDNAPAIIRDLERNMLIFEKSVYLLKSELKRKDYFNTNYFFRDKSRDDGIEIKRRTSEFAPIAYYTVPSTLAYIFKQTTEEEAAFFANRRQLSAEHNAHNDIGSPQNEAHSSPRNCFTIMHMRHMNDPIEGSVLLNYLCSGIKAIRLLRDNSPEAIRDAICDNSYIFLKSFTEKIDELPMWNRYASDRSEGSDSNGCCVLVNPETFIKNGESGSNTSIGDSKVRATEDDDNTSHEIYRVVYLNNQGKIVGDKSLNSVRILYEIMKDSLKRVDSAIGTTIDLLNLSSKNKLLEIADRFIMNCLQKIVFLFKSNEYADEKESRYIETKGQDEFSEIHQLPNGYICIQPFFQVYLDGIILGPKMKKPDHMLAHYQYCLDSMRKENGITPDGEKMYFPESIFVRKSKLHYQD